jgi:hypothetical protein
MGKPGINVNKCIILMYVTCILYNLLFRPINVQYCAFVGLNNKFKKKEKKCYPCFRRHRSEYYRKQCLYFNDSPKLIKTGYQNVHKYDSNFVITY